MPAHTHRHPHKHFATSCTGWTAPMARQSGLLSRVFRWWLFHVVSCCFMLFHVVSCCFMLFHNPVWHGTSLFSRASHLPEAAGAHDLQMELRFLRCSAVTWRLRMGDFTAFSTKMIQNTHLMRENGDWPLEFGVSTQFPDKPISHKIY